nr:hypothetical protein [Tanacetum cinerariifolium]
MVVILEKGEHNTDFHPMVDFLEASPLRTVPLFADMLVHQGQGSGTLTEPHQTPSPEAHTPLHSTHPSSSIPPITTTSIPTVTPIETPPIRQYTRRTRIAQSFVPLTVADEPASPQRDISQGEACPTDSDFIAYQDRATIDKSSTLPYDSAPQERVKQLEEIEGVAASNSRDDAPIKGRSMDEGEAATERVSDDTEKMATVLTLMDAATVLASGVIDVPTGSGSIPTASTPAEGSVPTGSDEVLIASPVFATATVVARELEEQLEKEDQRRAEQIARDAEIARIHAEEELQSMINGLDSNNETIAKYLEEYRWKVKDFRDMTFEAVEAKFNSVCKQMEHFIPMGLKEEAERIKRKEVYVEALQVRHLIIGWKVHSEGLRSYWKITRLGGSSACYQFFIDLLKHLDREDLNQLWRLVKETLSTRPPTTDKEMELWVELSRLYKPDKEDQLWTHTQNFMHAPVDWKLYDSCGVHHVAAKDKEIFMLVEKDYPLRKEFKLLSVTDLLDAVSELLSFVSEQGL